MPMVLLLMLLRMQMATKEQLMILAVMLLVATHSMVKRQKRCVRIQQPWSTPPPPPPPPLIFPPFPPFPTAPSPDFKKKMGASTLERWTRFNSHSLAAAASASVDDKDTAAAAASIAASCSVAAAAVLRVDSLPIRCKMDTATGKALEDTGDRTLRNSVNTGGSRRSLSVALSISGIFPFSKALRNAIFLLASTLIMSPAKRSAASDSSAASQEWRRSPARAIR
mmetsp:Transcript_5757/g.11006  ORF Transcript_5757/g.11006 Transcript_5757/m.11006 type:complete len:224 (-) Transcript_5757:1744-2415(-)